jgi:hypothetical protein
MLSKNNKNAIVRCIPGVPVVEMKSIFNYYEVTNTLDSPNIAGDPQSRRLLLESPKQCSGV